MTCCRRCGSASRGRGASRSRSAPLLTFGPSTLTFEAQEAIGGILSIVAVAPDHLDDLLDGAHGPRTCGPSSTRGSTTRSPPAAAAVVIMAAARRRARGPRDRAVPVGRRAGRRARRVAPDHRGGARPRDAIVIGCLFYRGALRINLRTFFTWTGRVPDRRLRRRARLRHPRPPGGRDPARASTTSPGTCRRPSRRPASRHDPQGRSSTSRRRRRGSRPIAWVVYVVPTTIASCGSSATRGRPRLRLDAAAPDASPDAAPSA